MTTYTSEDEPFYPPRATLASRIASLNGHTSYRGTLLNHSANVEMTVESRLESGFLHTALRDRANAAVQEQPNPVQYRERDGSLHEHTFDALLIRVSKLRIAVDVKPSCFVASSRVEEVQALIRDQVGSDFADLYVVKTEHDIHPDEVADARLILRARRMPDKDADEAVLPFFPLGGATLISQIVAATGLFAAAFNAIVRAIDDGTLVVVGLGRIGYDTMISRPGAVVEGPFYG